MTVPKQLKLSQKKGLTGNSITLCLNLKLEKKGVRKIKLKVQLSELEFVKISYVTVCQLPYHCVSFELSLCYSIP